MRIFVCVFVYMCPCLSVHTLGVEDAGLRTGELSRVNTSLPAHVSDCTSTIARTSTRGAEVIRLRKASRLSASSREMGRRVGQVPSTYPPGLHVRAAPLLVAITVWMPPAAAPQLLHRLPA